MRPDDPDAPTADVVEQRQPPDATADDVTDADLSGSAGLPMEADPADVAEQRAEVPDEEEDAPR